MLERCALCVVVVACCSLCVCLMMVAICGCALLVDVMFAAVRRLLFVVCWFGVVVCCSLFWCLLVGWRLWFVVIR